MNLNGKQILAIVAAVLSVLAVSTVQLTDIIGPGAAKSVASVAGLGTTIMNSILAIITGQAQIVKDVQDMPGVEKITINAKANSTLATLAMDNENQKIEATPAAAATVAATARAST